MSDAVLKVDGVSKSFRTKAGEIRALDSVGFELRPGERVAILGRNGAGKTTLIKSIIGLVRVDAGRILVDGQDVSRSPDYLGNVGVTLEGVRNLYWKLTPYENARYFSALRRPGVDRRRIMQLLEEFRIPNPTSVDAGKLSTGNKQKVAIVCALAHDPALLLLDEPTLGLDVEAVAHIKSVLAARARDDRRTVVIASHDLAFVEDVCERVIVFDAGRVRFDGAPSTLRAAAGGYAVSAVLDDRAAASALAAGWKEQPDLSLVAEGGSFRVSFRAASTADVVQAFRRLEEAPEGAVVDVEVGKASLESAYLRLAGQARANARENGAAPASSPEPPEAAFSGLARAGGLAKGGEA